MTAAHVFVVLLTLLLQVHVTTTAVAATCSHGDVATVVVDHTAFTPGESRVCERGTITWSVEEGGHTIVADDNRFAFRGDAGGTLPVGVNPSFTAGDVGEFIGYHCEIHPSMRGRIVVGNGPPPPPGSTIRVPEDQPTLHDAVIVAQPGHTVEVAAGVHEIDRTLVVDADRITIRGVGASPDDVVISGRTRFLHTVVAIPGSHVTVANLTVAGGRIRAIHATGDAIGLVDVDVTAGLLSRDGVVLDGIDGAGLQRVRVSGLSRAAVEVRDCVRCGAMIRDLHAHGSTVGVHVRDAAGVVITESALTGNTTGIVVHGLTRHGAVSITNSLVRHNTRPPSPLDPSDQLLTSGSGIVLAGVTDSLVDSNTVSGHHGYGIAVAMGPAARTQVRNNVTDDNAAADLAWDGMGHGVCFTGPSDTSSDPPTLLTTASCDAVLPLSPLHPLVTVRVLAGPTSGASHP